MYFLWKERHQLINELTYNPEFKKYTEILFEIFKLSRIPENHKNSQVIYEVQKNIWTIIVYFESLLKPAIKDAKDKGIDDYNDDLNIFAYKIIIRIARTIVDGIVWRNIGYRRSWAKILSHNKRNSLDVNFDRLLEAAEACVGIYIPIISDLTETVRIWDLLFIDKDGFPLITEAKNGKDGKLDLYNLHTINKNQPPTKQILKLIDTQYLIFSGEIDSINTKIEDNSAIVPYRYFNEIRNGIAKAEDVGCWVGRLNKIMSVRIIDSEKIWKLKGDKLERYLNRAKKLISTNEENSIMSFSNLDMLQIENNHIFGWLTPYSIFPFDDRTAMKLMTWELQIVTYINIKSLCRCFEENGWNVTLHETTNDNISRQARNFSALFWLAHADDTFMTIKKEDWYFQTIPSLEIMRLWHEFLSPKTMLETANHLYKVAKRWPKQNKGYAIDFIADNQIFV